MADIYLKADYNGYEIRYNDFSQFVIFKDDVELKRKLKKTGRLPKMDRRPDEAEI